MSELKRGVIQEWVYELDWIEQVELISSIRSIDCLDTNTVNDSIDIIKQLRYLIVYNNPEVEDFMTDTLLKYSILSSKLSRLNDSISLGHISPDWLNSIIRVIKIIMDKHMSVYVRTYWNMVYTKYNESIIAWTDNQGSHAHTVISQYDGSSVVAGTQIDNEVSKQIAVKEGVVDYSTDNLVIVRKVDNNSIGGTADERCN